MANLLMHMCYQPNSSCRYLLHNHTSWAKIKSGKNVIQVWNKEERGPNSQLHYFSTKRIFSLEFYSSGKANQIKTLEDITAMIQNDSKDYMVINRDDFNQLPTSVKNHFEKLTNGDDSELHLILLKEVS